MLKYRRHYLSEIYECAAAEFPRIANFTVENSFCLCCEYPAEAGHTSAVIALGVLLALSLIVNIVIIVLVIICARKRTFYYICTFFN